MGKELVPYTLKPGFIYLARGSGFIRTVVGSAVAVCIWDECQHLGTMNHFVYPTEKESGSRTAIFGRVSMVKMVQLLKQAGCKRENLSAHILGGAHPMGVGEKHVGAANVEVARSFLRRLSIPVVSEDVGGAIGRKIVFNVENGNVAVVKVRNLRKSDWVEDVWGSHAF